ncbi:MAG: type I-E CRISPR-associated protein Cse1/CasA [Bacillota bacterium]|nr:type I-E CRISPR-associated protein Cse1/CasA [Bacillota bacterium]
MAYYNVLDEPWICIEDLFGATRKAGIRETLKEAQNLRRICDSSPLVSYGIQRMLIAFLMDALRPQTVNDLADILSDGAFNDIVICEYIKQCNEDGESFNLFDERKPFYQSSFDERWDDDGKIRSIALLFHEQPSGNNHLHFDHRLQSQIAYSPEECVGGLCAVNVFCTAGLQGPSSINGAPPIFSLINGESLFETLVMSMIAIRENQSIPFDNPPVAWRGGLTVEPNKSVPFTSVLYGLTWQARRVLLISDDDGKVRNMYFQKGLKFEGFESWRDPHVAYNIGKNGRSSLKPQESKALWRDIGTLLLPEQSNADHFPPIIINHCRRIYRNINSEKNIISVSIFGLVTNQAQYSSWLSGELSIPGPILDHPDKALLIADLIHQAEILASELRKSLYFAQGNSREQDLREQALNSFFQTAGSVLYSKFYTDVAQADPEISEWNRNIIANWKKRLVHEAYNIFSSVCLRMGTNARQLEKHVKAELYFSKIMNKYLKDGDD